MVLFIYAGQEVGFDFKAGQSEETLLAELFSRLPNLIAYEIVVIYVIVGALVIGIELRKSRYLKKVIKYFRNLF